MKTILVLLIIAAIAFVVYAVATQYKNTDPSKPVQKRVWAAVVAAGVSIGGALGAYLTQWSNQ